MGLFGKFGKFTLYFSIALYLSDISMTYPSGLIKSLISNLHCNLTFTCLY